MVQHPHNTNDNADDNNDDDDEEDGKRMPNKDEPNDDVEGESLLQAQ